MTPSESSRWARWIPTGIVAFGAVSFSLDIALDLVYVGPGGLRMPTGVVSNGLMVVFTAIIVVGGHWLAHSDLEVARYLRVAAWTAGFSLVFTATNLVLIALYPDSTFYGNLAWALFAVYVGGAGGLVGGLVEAKAIDRAVKAERAAVSTEHLEAQRQWLDYLNSLLRHEVLNNANVIQGYASLLLEDEDLPSPAHGYVETIHRQSQDMTDVIGDVRVLVRSVEHSAQLRSVDVVDVIAEELEDLRATDVDVESELSADDDTYVLADDLLPRIFSNLLSNAVEHNPDESPRVTVDVETRAESVRVEVADNGPGVPDAERETLFERNQKDHNLGLYLVRVLADRYGGDVELVETGPGGSVFAVELPGADPPTDEDDSPEGSSSAADSGETGQSSLTP